MIMAVMKENLAETEWGKKYSCDSKIEDSLSSKKTNEKDPPGILDIFF